MVKINRHTEANDLPSTRVARLSDWESRLATRPASAMRRVHPRAAGNINKEAAPTARIYGPDCPVRGAGQRTAKLSLQMDQSFWVALHR